MSTLPAGSRRTLHEHAAAVSPGLMRTGLARVTLNPARGESDPAEITALLEATLGARHKMHCYAYVSVASSGWVRLSVAAHGCLTPVPTLQNFVRVAEGCYSVKYRRGTPDYTPAKFAAYSAVSGWLSSRHIGGVRSLTPQCPHPLQAQCDAGVFAGLPCEGNFSDAPYWDSVAAAAESATVVHYPSDIAASVMASGLPGVPDGWDMSRFDAENDLLRALVPTLGFKDGKISGYTTPMLYVGGPGATFAVHSEDQNLYSCNYLVAGAPKVWHAVPPEFYSKVVAFVHSTYASDPLVRSCPQAVMHKRFLITPEALARAGIPVSRIVQRPGDMILTAPGAFHWGYNTGYNLAEASNFANKAWYFGGHFHDSLSAGQCTCKEYPRFTFDDIELRAGLKAVGGPFGITAADLG